MYILIMYFVKWPMLLDTCHLNTSRSVDTELSGARSLADYITKEYLKARRASFCAVRGVLEMINEVIQHNRQGRLVRRGWRTTKLGEYIPSLPGPVSQKSSLGREVVARCYSVGREYRSFEGMSFALSPVHWLLSIRRWMT